MEEEESININLIIADRPYPLKIKKSEEEEIRIAAKQINQKVKDFQLSYSAKDKQDYLAMCALTFAVERIANNKKHTSAFTSINDELSKLEKHLETN